MSETSLPAIAARTAAEAARDAPLEAEARALLRDDLGPRGYLDALAGVRLFPDAVRFLSHALAKREAVWWACLCARSAHGPTAPGPIAEALHAAETWAAEPDEPNRRAAEAAAEAAGLGTPAGCAAMAAFWGGGSLTPAGLPEVPPGEFFTAKGVAGAVMLAAVEGDPAQIPETFRRFLALGLDVAAGSNRWAPQAAPARPAAGAAQPIPRPAARPTRRLDTWE